MDKLLILNKIQEYYNFSKETEFAEFLGIKPQTLSNWKKRKTFDIDIVYTKCVDISPDFILAGKGDMLRKESSEANEPREAYNITPIIEINPETTANCLVADVRASAGFGSLMESRIKLEELPAINLLNAPFGLNVAFQVEGDSMHNTIRHLDYVAGNHITDIKDIKDGYVYIIIEKGNGATCKRVYKEKGVFRIVSDNPMYPEYVLGEKDIVAIFKAFQRFSSDFRNYFDEVRTDVNELKNGFKELKKQFSSLEKRLK